MYAVAAGGSDNGAPGLRSQYHPHYYAAFVLDPDGNRIELQVETCSSEEAFPQAHKEKATVGYLFSEMS